MKLRTTLIAALLMILGACPVLAREPAAPATIAAEQLIARMLAGEEDKEVKVHVYTFPPGAATPWHIHPDAHEVAYVVEGDFTFQFAGEEPKRLQPGEAEYLPPNIVHRGMNEGGEPVRLFVVRIKPKDKPLVEEVPAPQ